MHPFSPTDVFSIDTMQLQATKNRGFAWLRPGGRRVRVVRLVVAVIV